MLIIPDGCIHFCHIGVYLCPLLRTTGLDKDIVVIFQGCAIGSGIGEDLMQSLAFLHTRSNSNGRFTTNLGSTILACLILQSQHLLCVRHFLTEALHVVVIGFLIDVPQASATH